jgi:hypothetical protein
VARCVAAHSPIRGNRAHNRATELTSDATIEIRETPLVIDPTTTTHKEKQVNARFQCYLSLIRKLIKVLWPPFRTIMLALCLECLLMEPLSLVSYVLVLLVRWAYLIFFIWTLRDMAAVFYLTCLMLCARVFNLAKTIWLNCESHSLYWWFSSWVVCVWCSLSFASAKIIDRDRWCFVLVLL